MRENKPLIYWIRRDMRLSDHPGLTEAGRDGRGVVPVFVLDPETEGIGAAARWRWGLGIEAFRDSLRGIGSTLILRRGTAEEVLANLAEETGAAGVHWSRAYDPDSVKRDARVKAALRQRGLEAESHPGHLIFEPWTTAPKTGDGYFKVYTPFWKSLQNRDVPPALAPVTSLRAPEKWPASETLSDWKLGAGMNRGAAVVARHVHVGEAAAHGQLEDFLDGPVETYDSDRDRIDRQGTSGLSENLTYGEISAREVWHAAGRAMNGATRGALTFRKEIAWREFAYHLVHHTPRLTRAPWREEWRDFPWRRDNADAERWRRGITGEAVVDAAMREMFVTGRMHNRCRMIVASYLTKHLMTDWRVGQRWFEDCLIDWDPANNALGWQWTAGCGPDAAPYFRVYNPATQAEKFDPDGAYRARFLHGFGADTHEDALSYFRAVPEGWRLAPDDPRPAPVVDLGKGREAALNAYGAFRT
jgi:deoxyribodipyrimidine photo-lyase